jgi:RHS repeat-associated protein
MIRTPIKKCCHDGQEGISLQARVACVTCPRAFHGAVSRPRIRAAHIALVVALWCLILTTGTASAQTKQYTEEKADLALRSDLRVDPSTLGMNLEIPLGAYPGRGGLGLSVSIRYSSKLWRMNHIMSYQGRLRDITWLRAEYAEHSAAGWTSSLDTARIVYTGNGQLFTDEGYAYDEPPPSTEPPSPGEGTPNRSYVRRIHAHLPDGSSHEMRVDDRLIPFHDSYDFSGTYRSTDGSRMRFETSTNTLYLPDGSFYVFGPILYPNGSNTEQRALLLVDRHGNTLNYDDAARQWSDTLGRVIGLPLPANPSAGEIVYLLPGVGTSSLRYVFRWKNLADALAQNEQLKNRGDRLCSPSSSVVENALFRSDSAAMLACSDPGELFNPVVLGEVVLPTGQKYVFKYNTFGEIAKVSLPTGGYERYQYAHITPMGDASSFIYEQTNRGVTHRFVSPRGDGTDEAQHHWSYTAGFGNTFRTTPYVTTVTSPDGTRTERYLHTSASGPDFGFENILAGMPAEERVYSPAGDMLRRTLTEWADDFGPLPGGNFPGQRRNPKVTKQVSILLDANGLNALSATTVNRYEQASQPLNLTSTTQYGYDSSMTKEFAKAAAIGSFNPPNSLALRTTETTYLDTQPYRDRELVSLPTSTTVRAGMPASGAVASFTETHYDEPGYSPLPCHATVGRSDGGALARGNVTTVSRRLYTAAAPVDLNTPTTPVDLKTHAQYDACGGVRNTWDATGYLSQIEYSPEFHYAFPTRILTPVPDPDGSNGASASLETQVAYDSNTGRVVSVTDATNRQTTAYSFTDEHGVIDPLNRLRKVSFPDGGWTKYDYGNAPGNLFIRTRTALDAARNTDAYQYFDGLGRPSRSFSFNGSALERTWIAADTVYDDAMLRVSGVSNPYFVQTLGGSISAGSVLWTTTEYDDLGRVESVTTPDGARVVSAYVGNEMTVTDQADRKRLSVTDSLGRLVKVIEAPGAYAYVTIYDYDALDNLRAVTQGEQTRTFVYDSLSRLILARVPEQEATLRDIRAGGSWSAKYIYDANGNLEQKTDSRNVVTNYTYDALNRVTARSYSDETPTVTYLYDGVGMWQAVGETYNFAGRLTSVKSSVSETHYNKFDALGRVKQSSQVTDKRSYGMSYEYNLAGGMTSQTYPSGRVVHTNFDPAGRISEVYRGQGAETRFYASSFAYTAHGAVSDMRLGGASVDRPDTGQFCVTGPCKGLWEHWDYNSRLQPMRIGVGAAQDRNDASKLQINYAYGEVVNGVLDATKNNGNVESQMINIPAVNGVAGFNAKQSYEYDKLNRLESAREVAGGTEQWKQVYKYDRFGNRTFNSGTNLPALPVSLADKINNPTISASTNRINEQQDGDGVKDYEHDAAGNVMKNAEGRTFTYDAENRQVSLDKDPNTTEKDATYSYDGDGRRVKKVVSGVATTFVYDAGGRLVAEYTNSPQTQTGGTRFVIADMLGSTRLVANELGDVKERHDYLPFGEELFVGRTQQGYGVMDIRQKFTGYERDAESGLDFAQARYYASTQGRFTSVDPLMASANPGNPKTWNRYVYVLNNPLRLVDPTGMAAEQQQPPIDDPQDPQRHRTPIIDDQGQIIGDECDDVCAQANNRDRFIEGLNAVTNFIRKAFSGTLPVAGAGFDALVDGDYSGAATSAAKDLAFEAVGLKGFSSLLKGVKEGGSVPKLYLAAGPVEALKAGADKHGANLVMRLPQGTPSEVIDATSRGFIQQTINAGGEVYLDLSRLGGKHLRAEKEYVEGLYSKYGGQVHVINGPPPQAFKARR